MHFGISATRQVLVFLLDTGARPRYGPTGWVPEIDAWLEDRQAHGQAGDRLRDEHAGGSHPDRVKTRWRGWISVTMFAAIPRRTGGLAPVAPSEEAPGLRGSMWGA